MRNDQFYYSTETGRGTGLHRESIRIASETYKHWTAAAEKYGDKARVNCHRKWYTIEHAERSKRNPDYVDFFLIPVQ